MDKMLDTETSSNKQREQKIDYKAEITKMLAQMRVIDEHIKATQAETAQVRIETRVMLDQIKADLNVS